MSKLRRYYSKGNIYFVTCVTYKRQPILAENADLFWQAIEKVQTTSNFNIIAWVINPDHFHMIVDPYENNLSDLLKGIKLSFSMKYHFRSGQNKGRVWQLRFWDHIIRNENDMNSHIDYIHYNPVKHGLVVRPFDYTLSSIHEYKEYYGPDWGVKVEINIDGEFGE